MKLILTLIASLAFAATADVKELEIGKTGPMFDYKMTTTEGTETSLAQIKKANGTLLIFTATHVRGCMPGRTGTMRWRNWPLPPM
jgi:hypothetical protein